VLSKFTGRRGITPSTALRLEKFFGAVVSIFWFGGHAVLAGRLTAGQLFIFLVLTLTIAGSIGQFSGLWTGLQEALGAPRRRAGARTTRRAPAALVRPALRPDRGVKEAIQFMLEDELQKRRK
jgi:ABC-type multidrug transport system fused ATPase/permease subunit